MLQHVLRLLKDYNFLLKIVELILACVSTKILSQHEEYTIPRWLWIIYCIDSTTYAIIFFTLSLSHIFQKQREILTFTYFTIGILLHWIAGVSGITRSQFIIPEDSEFPQSELTIGIIFLCNSFLMLFEVVSKIYSHTHRMENDER